MSRVAGKVVIVTGGGSGLGAASSELLAKEGASIVVTDIDEAAAQRTTESITQSGGIALALTHDVTQQDRWEEIIRISQQEFGGVDVLVNNAGIAGSGGSIETSSIEEWRQVMQVNLDGVFLGCKAAVAAMRGRGGSIINISSVMGIVAAMSVSYSASKGGVRLLTKSVAAYCGENGYNIRCNSVHPGYIWTPMVQAAVNFVAEIENEDQLKAMLIEKHPIGRLGEAADIANGVLFLASDESSFMTGSELVIDGGYTAV